MWKKCLKPLIVNLTLKGIAHNKTEDIQFHIKLKRRTKNQAHQAKHMHVYSSSSKACSLLLI